MQSKQQKHGPSVPPDASESVAGVLPLVVPAPPDARWHLGARLRNYFITGLVVAGPIAITIGVIRWLITSVDSWVKPWLPDIYNPDHYLPITVPGVGLVIAILGLMLVGALTANLIGRTLISSGELMLNRMPIVRNVYGLLKQIFESIMPAVGQARFQKVGLIEFPTKGIWSIAFVTAEAIAEIKSRLPHEEDLVTVFVPTGFVPPTGFVCFVKRRDVVFVNLSVEDAAKIIVSGGMAGPEQGKLKALAEDGAQKASPDPLEPMRPRARTPETLKVG